MYRTFQYNIPESDWSFVNDLAILRGWQPINAIEGPSEKSKILASIERGIKDIKEGREYPIDTIWEQLQ
ncbi:MAG: hypothetical protein LIP02_00680 [Bacteroidales bacterium]|nr:hypothetical protein [Bacteroidales bacterium]